MRRPMAASNDNDDPRSTCRAPPLAIHMGKHRHLAGIAPGANRIVDRPKNAADYGATRFTR
jgi:hypothetical protein